MICLEERSETTSAGSAPSEFAPPSLLAMSVSPQGVAPCWLRPLLVWLGLPGLPPALFWARTPPHPSKGIQRVLWWGPCTPKKGCRPLGIILVLWWAPCF